ncbi:MAG: hypothetical protein Q8918_10535 [Bacteroidota bacterium]|nr:hypothetical protein [Bacteroidota bacterium]MDP4212723.1 hypothetical protein [Bacteroidota bacterium]MDP4250533.1 hypothetical protein [Bacteroidota bacterium]
MKKIILSVAFFSICLLFNQAQAQPGFQVHVNLGVQPAWIPQGYTAEDYYYLPDIQAYYYVPRRQFVYQEGGRWMFAASLPERCRSYDLYRGNKIAIHEARPYLHDEIYRERYSHYGNYNSHFPDRRATYGRHEDSRSGNGYGRGHRY